jgi:hypothetical protein
VLRVGQVELQLSMQAFEALNRNLAEQVAQTIVRRAQLTAEAVAAVLAVLAEVT